MTTKINTDITAETIEAMAAVFGAPVAVLYDSVEKSAPWRLIILDESDYLPLFNYRSFSLTRAYMMALAQKRELNP
jgi:hypothetical protein